MAKQSSEVYRGQRGKEKRALFACFRVRVIQDAYRARFFELFEGRRFKCGLPEKLEPELDKPPVLCIDHHIPMALGGHLVPGNLVSLCRNCNTRKLDSPPEAFYIPEELRKLKPLLETQKALFTFRFDEDRWMSDRETYLLDLGVHPTIVRNVLNDENHRHYVGYPCEESRIGITLSFDSIRNSSFIHKKDDSCDYENSDSH
ncbi:HNH endonuclease [Limnohabitans sp. JUR4]|uniref:HNH endonuclease n=1 Tax=Limnohabitans radicicola TaxID=2771427 RepID=A0A927ILG3_9BURK|nr:HNH endonuclease [Limnohabitans radicicola]